jgi:hypothetical protein
VSRQLQIDYIKKGIKKWSPDLEPSSKLCYIAPSVNRQEDAMGKKRRSHSAEFKAVVAMEALRY